MRKGEGCDVFESRLDGALNRGITGCAVRPGADVALFPVSARNSRWLTGCESIGAAKVSVMQNRLIMT